MTLVRSTMRIPARGPVLCAPSLAALISFSRLRA
jgi:hypothetical protein